MENPLIKLIEKTNAVLCVVKGVLQTSEKAEVTHTEKTDGLISQFWKVSLFFITTNTLP
jgi:hypothetical protein